MRNDCLNKMHLHLLKNDAICVMAKTEIYLVQELIVWL